MMKRNKLYTVNPWNVNMFKLGGDSWNTGSSYNPFPVGSFMHTKQQYYNAVRNNNNLWNGVKSNPLYGYSYGNTGGINFTTNYNDQNQRFNTILESANQGIGGWKTTGLNGSSSGGGGGTSGGLSSGAKSAIASGITTAGSLLGGLVKNGDHRDGFGNTMNTAGKALSTIGAATGNIWLAAAGTALDLGSEVLFSYGIGNEKGVRDNTSRLNNINFNATTMKELADQAAQTPLYKESLGRVKDGSFTTKGTETAMRLKREQDDAFDFATNSFTNAKNNILKNQLANDLYNYYNEPYNISAYGGPLNTFAMGGNKKKYRTTTKDKSGTITEVYVPGGYIAETITNEGDTIYKKPSDSWWNPFERVSARRAPNGPATSDYRRLQQEYRDAYKGSTESGNVGVDRVKDFINNLLGTSYDYGGPLGFSDNVSAVNYGFMTDYLTEKKRQNDLKNKMTGMTQMPSFMPSYALGGDLQANGSDWTTGLTHVEAGGTHEENPYEGVQMGVDREGVPNLVEEDETVYNDYVYSNRIKCDPTTKEKFHVSKKRDITFADLSKKLEKEIAERPNDPISQAAFKAQMADLAEQQERQKQEMEAARAREAFEALSPEEQTALIQQYAQQEQMAQEQAMQEQVMAEQAAAEQQPTPEEIAMAEQQQMMQADGSQAALGETPQMACGGKINRFDEGGMKKKIYDLLGLKTQSDWNAWVKKNGLDEMNDVEDWDNILQNQALINAIAKDNPALRHALENKYDFGLYTPSAKDRITFPSITQGNWKKQTYEGWKDSKDPGWLEAVENWKNTLGDNWAETVKGYNREQIAEALRNTKAFQRGTKWLQDSEDNRLRYLRELYNNAETPAEAKKYALKFIDENGNWREKGARDYETIFNNPSGRAANPGTYWHTPLEAVRDAVQRNYVINDDGTVELLEGDLNGLTLDSTYKWADPQSDHVNNYYKRAAQAAGNDAAKATGDAAATAATGDDREVVPVHSKLENLRYAGLFGPAVGLGMQALGIGRPDTSGIEAAANIGKSPAHLASPHLIGDYMRYTPFDRLFYANQLQANARATDRALANNSGANRGTAMAGLLANGYNTNNNLGNLYRQGEEYNRAQYEKTKEFNRGTNQFNADVLNRTSQFNADALNRGKQYNAQLAMQAAQAKMDADAGWYNGIYGNVAGLFKGLGDLGREKAQENRIADMAATGIFGTMKPGSYIANGMLRYETDEERAKRLANQKVKTAKGGKIKRKKGFTY